MTDNHDRIVDVVRPPRLPPPVNYDEIETGIREVCRLINESGIGRTEFSCEGHVVSERPDWPEKGGIIGVVGNPYVLFHVWDWERTLALIPHLLEVREFPVYRCTVELDGSYVPPFIPRFVIRLLFYNDLIFEECTTPTRERRRHKAMQQARDHLLLVLRQWLAPQYEVRTPKGRDQ